MEWTRANRHGVLRAMGWGLAAFCFGIMLHGVLTFSDPPAWNQMVLGDGRFSVRFPGRPEQTVQRDPQGENDLRVTHFLYTLGESVYAIGYVDYDGGMGRQTQEVLLNSSRDSFLNDREGRMVQERNLSYNGYLGRELEVDFPNGLVAWYRLYVVKNRLYILSVVTTDTQRYMVPVRPFMDSFDLVEFY